LALRIAARRQAGFTPRPFSRAAAAGDLNAAVAGAILYASIAEMQLIQEHQFNAETVAEFEEISEPPPR
jgi:hypothetical protein